MINNLRPLLLLPVAILLLLYGTSYSNQLPATGKTAYSMVDLCLKALETAEQIKLAENDLVIAMEEKRRALSVLMPRATAFGSYLAFREPDTKNPDQTSRGIRLNQSFTLNGKELIALGITRDGIDRSQWVLTAVKNDYVFQVASTYFQILSRWRALEIAQADVDRLEKHRNAVNERLKVGDVTRTALYRAEAQLSKARTELVRSKNDLSIVRASLQNLVTIQDGFMLLDGGATRFIPFVYSFEALKQDALEKRAEILAAQKALEIARKTVKYKQSAYWPTLDLEGGYSHTRSEFDEPVSGTATTEDTSIGATLAFTLFDGGLRNADIKQARADERKALHTLESEKKRILLEARQAWLNYETTISVQSTLKDELKSARENFNAVTMQFNYGMADSVDMMDANTLLVTAERQLSDADYSHSVAILAIMLARGDIVSVLTQQP
ncbi:MAG: TolC family protein [Desulfobacteraceae bacterium]|nr:TolC family protein [Desulfobacteraceae bacterium]